MSWWQVVFLAVLQGLTEFLPISSSVHLAIASRVFFAGDAGASFTAVTQLGTELAVLVYFARDIWRIVMAWVNGLVVKAHREWTRRTNGTCVTGSATATSARSKSSTGCGRPSSSRWHCGCSGIAVMRRT